MLSMYHLLYVYNTNLATYQKLRYSIHLIIVHQSSGKILVC